MTDDQTTGVEGLRAAVARTGKFRQSPLFRWMRARQAAFAAFLAEDRPTWEAVAEGLVSQGFADKDGRPINPATVRNTWWRVRRDMAAARAGVSCKRVTKAAPHQAVHPKDATEKAAMNPPDSGPRQFGFVSFKGYTPGQKPAFDPYEGADDDPRPPRRFGVSKVPE